jgi:hypothetical protein
VAVILKLVAKEKSAAEPRGRTIPLWGEQFLWWPQAVKRKLRELGVDQKFLSNYIEASTSDVSRCLSLKKPLYDLLIAISDALEIPYPVVLPESEEEALEIARQRRLVRRDAQMAQITAGVPNRRENRQIVPITLADVVSWKSQQGSKKEHPEEPSRASRSR